MADHDEDVPDLDEVRRIHRTLEPCHAMVYFAPQATEIYGRLGLDARSAYFASRSAALGEVPHQVVTATFFNFSPDVVERALTGVWDHTSPDAVLAARLEVADTALRATLGDEALASSDMDRAAHLARQVASQAQELVDGRPLFAAHAALEWPSKPHLVLWHAATLLREFRGDAHIAALLVTGLDGLDAVVIHAASRQIPEAFLRATRGWPDGAWTQCVELHRQTGWLAPDDGPDGSPVLSDDGIEQREAIEVATDRVSILPWLAIGSEGIAELRELVRPWARSLSDSMFAQFGT